VVSYTTPFLTVPNSTQFTYRKSSWWKRNQQRLTPWIFLFPGLLLFLVYVIWPIFNSLYISLLQWDGLSPAIFVGISNYVELLDDEYFYISLMNNLKWLILFMLAVPIGLGLAIFLNQTIFGIRLIKSLFFFPFVISQVVIGIIFSWFYNPRGVIGPFLDKIGLGNYAILADENFATYGIIFAGIYPQIAYCMILYLTGLNNLNTDQIEAGRMDGAKGLSLFKNIILPQTISIVLPPLTNQTLTLIKESAVLSTITVHELTMTGLMVQGETFRPFEVFIMVALLYWALNETIATIMRKLEKKFSKDRKKTETTKPRIKNLQRKGL